MLSIAKLRVGQEAYQLTGVAQGLDDYYTGSGEAPGVWMGGAAERLGLDGEVEPDDLRAILAGIAPESGGLSPNGATIRPHPRRVPGFDLCFKAPKSLSVLYAVSDDPRVQGAIIEAGEAAVGQALGWLEREAIRVRRGNGNERQLADLAKRDPAAAAEARVKVLPATGVAAAAFRHRTSRAGDPLLHWHVLVPNLVEGPDGRWSAFVHPELYRNIRAAGEVFQTAVRAEVTARLGLEWRPGRHVPEVAGVPQTLCDRFSKRSREIEAWLDATGTPADQAGRQEAVLATRRGKPELEGERFDTAWKAEALAAGWGPEHAEQLLAGLIPSATGTPGTATVDPAIEGTAPFAPQWRLPEWVTGPDGEPVLYDRLVHPDDWVRTVLENDLTMPDATFTGPQLAQLIAARLGDGATATTVERICERVLASPHVIPIVDSEDPDVARWTSRDHLHRERRLLTIAHESRDTRSPVARRLVDDVLAQRSTLGDDQAAAVRALAETSDGVAMMIGPAGTGKTYTLDTLRSIYQAAGYQVLGAAPSARAALGLATGAHIPAVTMHRLLHDWANNHNLPSHRTALVVDEAGMAATRELEPLVSTVVAHGGRVLLVGDHRQIPSVTAGGAFAALATDKDNTVATLTVNRRQTHRWERDALAGLRKGNVAQAVDAYRQHGRVLAQPDRGEMVATAVGRWFDEQAQGNLPVLLAGTNEVVDALNTAVRHELVARGGLPAGPALAWGGLDFAAGDRVVIRRNSYREQLLDGTETVLFNGETGTIVDGGPNGLAVRMDTNGRTVAVRGEFIAQGHLGHAYALTTTRAQGGTWDVGIGVGLDGLYREGGYTQLSRGRESNWLILTSADLDQVDAELERHGKGIPLPGESGAGQDTDPQEEAHEELVRSLERSRAKLLALARDPHADHIATIAGTQPLAQLEARARFCRSVEHEATRIVGADARALAATADCAQHTAEHLTVGQRVKAHDRENIGTVVDFDDHVGTVTVHFVSPDHKEATKELPWSKVTILDRNPEPRDLPDEAQAALDQLLEPIRGKLERWHAHLASRGVGPLEAGATERAAELAIDRAIGQLTYTQPAWLQHTLGPKPEPALAADTWTQAVREIAAYRTRSGIPDHASGLGQPPDSDSPLRQAWEEASAHAARSRLWLDTYNLEPVTPMAPARSLQDLEQRRSELEDLFATAPADQRDLIRRLPEGDLSSTETIRLLEAALDTQGARRDWILAHWPHVVEHAEITRTLETGTTGPHLPNLLEGLAQHDGPLGEAVRDNERWLRNTISHLVPADATGIDADTVDLLTAIATYRDRWNITHPDPLGQAAETDDQALERIQLTCWINDTRAALEPRHVDHQEPGSPERAPSPPEQLALTYEPYPARPSTEPLGL